MQGILVWPRTVSKLQRILTISCPLKLDVLMGKVRKRCAELGTLRYHLLVMVDSPKETAYMKYIFGRSHVKYCLNLLWLWTNTIRSEDETKVFCFKSTKGGLVGMNLSANDRDYIEQNTSEMSAQDRLDRSL